jgi:hypothetical protein
VHIQPLPEGYLLASGEFNSIRIPHTTQTVRTIRLTAWMADNFAVASTEGVSTNDDDFYKEYCRSCDHYFNDQELDRGDCRRLGLEDSDGNPVVSATVESRCPCYSYGLCDVDWPCAAGYDDPDESSSDDETFQLSPMAFAIDIEPFRSFFCVRSTSAWCQKATADGLAGDRWQAGNTYDDDRVCWGNDNDEPQTLDEAVATYSDAPGNSDLLSPGSFAMHRSRCRASTPEHPLPGLLVRSGYDALLVASAADTPAAYLLLRGSGIPAENGLIVIGLMAITHTLEDGSTIPAYATEAAVGGRRWLLINDPGALDDPSGDGRGLLLGQLSPDSPVPCTSPTPSSLALAAAAAS